MIGPLTGMIEELGRFSLMLRDVVRWGFVTVGEWAAWTGRLLTGRPRPRVLEARETVDQMLVAGVQSVPVTLVTAKELA